jgi:hypothetical protein
MCQYPQSVIVKKSVLLYKEKPKGKPAIKLDKNEGECTQSILVYCWNGHPVKQICRWDMKAAAHYKRPKNPFP